MRSEKLRNRTKKFCGLNRSSCNVEEQKDHDFYCCHECEFIAYLINYFNCSTFDDGSITELQDNSMCGTQWLNLEKMADHKFLNCLLLSVCERKRCFLLQRFPFSLNSKTVKNKLKLPLCDPKIDLQHSTLEQMVCFVQLRHSTIHYLCIKSMVCVWIVCERAGIFSFMVIAILFGIKMVCVTQTSPSLLLSLLYEYVVPRVRLHY